MAAAQETLGICISMGNVGPDGWDFNSGLPGRYEPYI
jgi:hypothetical protein